uniref:Uncharacterized protein n=2 Tax=Cacopsylla melanoneura TaxID=428564 RepID=A0A8D8QWI6_9HEMI
MYIMYMYYDLEFDKWHTYYIILQYIIHKKQQQQIVVTKNKGMHPGREQKPKISQSVLYHDFSQLFRSFNLLYLHILHTHIHCSLDAFILLVFDGHDGYSDPHNKITTDSST